jgi:hypothetical protein
VRVLKSGFFNVYLFCLKSKARAYFAVEAVAAAERAEVIAAKTVELRGSIQVTNDHYCYHCLFEQ